MKRPITTLAKLIVAMTLVFAAFVFVPVSDAAACAPEPAAQHQAVAHNHATDTQGSEPGVCAHGHCHHTTTARPVSSDFTLAEPFGQSRHALPMDDGSVSFESDGLMRPPRN